jgi:tetratricopeptide (TPR) repeat protein
LLLDDRRDELTILGADRAQQAFDISPMIDAPDDLALLARALSMRTFDASGVLVDLDSRGVGKLVAQVNAMPALNMVPTKQQTLLWHKLRLAAASADSRDRYSARFHRERIMAAEPAEPRWYLERADDRIAEGRPVDAVADYTKALDFGAAGWEPWVGRAIAHVFANESRQAAADFGHAIEVGDTDEATLLNHLLINAAIGDTRAFETSKARLIRVGPRPASGTLLRDRVMRALAIGVYVDPDCRDAVAFIREKGGETPVFGAADKYCAGDFEAARGTLEDTIRRDAGDKPSAEAFLLSMVYHHLGDTKAASRWLARGRQWRSEIPDQQRLAADHQLESLIQWHPSLSVTPTIELQALERAAETLTGGRGQTPDAPNRR